MFNPYVCMSVKTGFTQSTTWFDKSLYYVIRKLSSSSSLVQEQVEQPTFYF